MSLLSDLSNLVVKYSRPLETYVYTLLGGLVASQAGVDSLGVATTATASLLPAAVALAHDVLNDVRQLRSDVNAVKAAAEALPAK